MGKKRGQEKDYKDDAPPEFTDSRCPHTRKVLDLSLIKKAVQDGMLNACQDCKGDEKEGDSIEIENTESPLIWVCLKCGHRGCGRDSDQQHAIKHFEKSHSDPHCLVVSLENWNIWCYLCDDDVPYSSTGWLSQFVTYIQKQALLSEPTRKTTNKTVKEHENQIHKLENKNEQQKDSKKGGTRTEEKEKPHKEIPQKNTSLTVKGFNNLGNTCFFNAVMQILSHTELLKELLRDLKDNETTIKITPHLSSELETKKSVVTPKELFSQVCKKAARFRGFQQQDSHELLRYLLDGMRSEEIKRKSAGIFKTLNDSGKQEDAEESKKLIKEYEKKGELQNFVDQVFGGELTSTIMCEECKTISLVTEMFLDLSLPVSDEAYRKKSLKKSERKPSINEDEDYGVSPASNADNGIPTATSSKYQLKKDKKHAKKQAKNQRRQQKHEGKVLLAHATEQNSEEHQNGEESSSQGNLSQPDTENLKELNGCTDSSEPVLQNEKEVSDTELCEDTSSSGHDNANEHTEAEKNNTDGHQLDPLENLPEPSNTTTVHFKQFSVLTPDENLVQDLSKISLNGNIVSHDDIELEIGNCDGPFDAKEYTVANQDPVVAFCTLANRETPGKQESSTQSCLYQFTQKEKLTGTNRLRCNTCSQRKYKEPKSSIGDKKSVYTDAQKQMLISMAPPVLTLHLKRFQQVGSSACKVNKQVRFPQILDLAPFCTVNCKNVAGDKGVLYSLYGIVEHSGTMRSGHYTAYVKVKSNCHLSEHLNGMTPQVSEAESLKGSWFHISDSRVQAVPESKVQNSQAYLLFYERILHQTHTDKH
ncbi:ubiquitin carboxyl-terminal hydrolase 16-like isoform X2 [Polyodon spathula]|uniref:ubiquitin carboxyl-terminal hydrolase 16-like isoform X2 n=1 Tax=Polyodon spathula TaxID=7913 RepID=UPI001B7E0D85|nr:ubiquitin carboxyl-terminal hydrolase 16-like isoform X2 [Polyodon spathula]